MNIYIKSLILSAALVTGSGNAGAQSWDGVTEGKTGRVEVTSGLNYGFRVFVKNNPPLCGSGGQVRVYLNSNDDNYQAYVSVLNSAWLTSRTVVIYAHKDVNDAGKIGFLVTY